MKRLMYCGLAAVVVGLSLLASDARGSQGSSQDKGTLFRKPFPGLVPDSETAGLIAKAMLRPLVGPKEAKRCSFSKAVLIDDSWIVHTGFSESVSKVGGKQVGDIVAHHWPQFKIARSDGAVEVQFG